MTSNVRFIAATALVVAATPAMAHTGLGPHVHGFVAGFSHPLGGIDHVLAMATVGLWAGMAGGRAAWAWPMAFVTAMAVAAGFGMAGVTPGGLEVGIALSVVMLGVLAAVAMRAPLAVGAAACAAFAVFHGLAHGAEMPANAAGLAYGMGFVAATSLLHALGLALSALGRTVLSPVAVRFAGGGVALAGLTLLAA